MMFKIGDYIEISDTEHLTQYNLPSPSYGQIHEILTEHGVYVFIGTSEDIVGASEDIEMYLRHDIDKFRKISLKEYLLKQDKIILTSEVLKS